MLATHLALFLPEDLAPSALVVWSGVLINENEWRGVVANRKGLKVLQSHGTSDQILPYVMAEWLRDFFQENGLQTSFFPFDGAHTIPFSIYSHFTSLINSL